MSIDISWDMSWKPEKGFFDFIREWREDLKDFLSEKLEAIRNTLSNLNILKNDISRSSSNPDSSSVRESVEFNSKSLKDKLTQICVRSRKYWVVNKDDLWSVSFWKLQFHGKNAEKVLTAIKRANPSRFDSVMTDPLFRDIKVACASKWNSRQEAQFWKLMDDSTAQHEMDKVVDETIETYLSLIKKRWVSDSRATLAFWRICNYWPAFAEKIKNIMVSNWKNINDYNQVIDCYERNTTWRVQGKFQKPDPALWNKNIREFIGECRA